MEISMLNRRDFIRITAGTTLAATLAPVQAETNETKPNLLIIQTDEHNFRTLGCYRKQLSEAQAYVWGKGVAVETPNIDWIAEHGAICNRFYASTPVCSPSRSSFVSGKYPQNTPVITNNIPLQDDIITFAEVLGKNGYAAGYAGKWHLDGSGKPQWAPERKFGFTDNRYMFNRGHWKKMEDTSQGPRIAARNEKGKPSYDLDGADEKSFTTDFLMQKAIDFINEHRHEPFCYMLSIPDPHGPNTVRTPYDTMYSHLDFQLPRTANKSSEGLPKWAKKSDATRMNAKLLSQYFGMIKCIDDNIGKIFTVLRDKKILDNTIIVFTADHGDMCFEHARHNKGIPLEASAKIPFVIHYPAKIKPGTVVNKAMSCVDFKPTILALMNQRNFGNDEGRDCSELFIKSQAPAGWKDMAFFRGTDNKKGGSQNWFGVISERYKLVCQLNEKPWLYDLQEDPDELVNYYDWPDRKEIVKTLSQALLEYGRKYHDHFVLHPDNIKQLQQAVRKL